MWDAEDPMQIFLDLPINSSEFIGSLPCTWKGFLGAVLHPAEWLSALSFPLKPVRPIATFWLHVFTNK